MFIRRRIAYFAAAAALLLALFAGAEQRSDPTPGARQQRAEASHAPLPDLPRANSPYGAVALAHADSLTLPESEAPFYRYLWLPHEDRQLHAAYTVHRLHVNRLSTQGDFGEPHLVAQDLLRLDVRDYGWEDKLNVWEEFTKTDFVFHTRAKLLVDAEIEVVWPGGVEDGKHYDRGVYERVQKKAGDTIVTPARWLPQKQIYELRQRLCTEAPVLMGSWFFVQTVRQVSIRNQDEKVGYYNWLGIQKRDDMFALAGVNVDVARKRYATWKEAVRRSGIGQQSRLVVALGAQVGGRVWGTLDTFNQSGRGQPLRNLREGEFKHDAEEWYFYLANGLDGNALFNADGVAQASAPDQIGPDDSALRIGHDARVHVGLSCIRCHGVSKDMLQPLTTAIRDRFRQGGHFRLQDPNKKVYLELRSEYLRDINTLLQDDRQKYARAVALCTATPHRPQGYGCAEVTQMYGGYWNDYVEKPVTVMMAARELGVSADHLVHSLKKLAKVRGGLDLLLADFIDSPAQSLTRLEWEDSYQYAAYLCTGVSPQEVIEEAKKFAANKTQNKSQKDKSREAP